MTLRERFGSLLLAIAIAAIILAALGRFAPRFARLFQVDAGKIAAVPIRGGDFELASAEGPWRLSRHVAGRNLVLVYFGFTRCPDLCPNTLGSLARALEALPAAERARVLVVFVSVDHRSDTPAAVTRYAREFGENFEGVTGSKAQLDAVVAQFSSFYTFTELPASAMKYTVNHSGAIYVLDNTGTVLETWPAQMTDDDLRQRLRKYAG